MSALDRFYCIGWNKNFVLLGNTAYSSLSEWFRSDGARGSYVDVTREHPSCNPSCCSIYCLKCFEVHNTLQKDTIGDANTITNRRKGDNKYSVNKPIINYKGSSWTLHQQNSVRVILSWTILYLFICLWNLSMKCIVMNMDSKRAV